MQSSPITVVRVAEDVRLKLLARAQRPSTAEGVKRKRAPETKRARIELEFDVDGEGYQDMSVSLVERLYQDDMKWTLNTVEDMCKKEDDEIGAHGG